MGRGSGVSETKTMYRRGHVAIAMVITAATICLWSASGMAWEAGPLPATRKILPQTPMPTDKQIRLKAARNEWEAFQLIIRDKQGVKGVNVGLSDLCNSKSACVPAKGARLFRQHYLQIVTPSPQSVTLHERKPGAYPDPLIPFSDPYSQGVSGVGAPFDLGPAETGAVFVDLYVPPGTTPGDYAGTATVSGTGRAPVKIKVILTVWEFDIPQKRTIATAFGFGASQVRAFHGGTGSQPAAGYDKIVDRYWEALHEHRIDPTTVSGDVSFTFDASGKLNPVNWTLYDKAVGPWLDGSRFADGQGVTRFNVAKFRPGSGLGNMTESQYKQAAAAFAEHLKAKGWWDRAYIYAMDEPWLHDAASAYKRINEDVARLFAASSLWKNKVLVTGPFEKTIEGKVGIWCPVTPMYGGWFYGWKPYAGWETYTQRLAQGEDLWFYVCNANAPPYAGYDIDTAVGYEPRMVKWGAWYERATGFLYWRVSYWIDNDPWRVWANYKQFGALASRNGDGMLLYPGDHQGTAGPKGSPLGVAIDGPIVSFRLKQIRDGLEDWEMFAMAAKLGGEDYVRQQVRRAYKRFGDFMLESCSGLNFYYCPKDQPWSLDEEVLLDVRDKVAAKLLYLLHPAKYPDPELLPLHPSMLPRATPRLSSVDGASGALPGDQAATGCNCEVGEVFSHGPPALVAPLILLGLTCLWMWIRRGSAGDL